ncbi:ANTAR domain-containing protein [Streptomyces sp. ISL-1]|nr:ANTAR domain-containing protein [Streptomyces sp. ISL-1]
MAALEQEVGELKHALVSHAVIDQAIGTLIALGHMDAGQGWAVLQKVSQHTNIKLWHVAELVITWAQTGDLAADIRAELQQALCEHATPRNPVNAPRRGPDK